MISRVFTASLNGLHAKLVSVETDLSQGLPALYMVGLPDITVREARERIRAAIVNCGFHFPAKRITINLSPANTKKEGSHFDLPIAMGVLAAIGAVKKERISEYAFMGELSLTGEINRIDGALPLVVGLADSGIKKIVLPKDNFTEAALVKGVELFPVADLTEVLKTVEDGKRGRRNTAVYKGEDISYDVDYRDVYGHENVKRAVTIACGGNHGLLFIGEPGVGKSLIATRIPTVLPRMTYEECLEVTKIYSIRGELSKERPMITERPFRAPHHTVTGKALIGGGAKARPGELSLAHMGVLFLDELAEFDKNTLEMLRQPLEDRKTVISRMSGSVVFPCDVMLVAAVNPCPCGYFGSSSHECRCSQAQLNNYRNKLSGPLLDRIDMHIRVMSPTYGNFQGERRKNTSSAEIRAKVEAAREIQRQRYKKEKISFNAQLAPGQAEKYCILNEESGRLLEKAFETMGLSGRAYHKILKIARTIGDLEGSERIETVHLAEAIGYRMNYEKI